MGEIQSQKVVVITGCSSGIGLETAIACAKEGHKVFATMRNLNKKEKLEKRIKDEKLENIEISELDVSDADSIVNEIAKIARKMKKIDVKFKGKNYPMKVNNKDCIMLSQLYHVYQFQDGDTIKITMNKNNFELTVK